MKICINCGECLDIHIICPCALVHLFSLIYQINYVSYRYVLYKEKNMLLTEQNLARRHGYEMIQPERRRKVRKSMGAIKHVLGERKRKKITDHKAYLEELERFDGLMAKLELESDDEIEDAMDDEAEQISTTEKA